MPEELRQDATEIESLLGERQRLGEWLDRLEGASAAPQRVRERVRADYEGRLTEVVARLRSFTANLTVSLSELRNRLGEVEALKTEVDEEQAEAALRHLVGEFGDEEWHRIESDCRGKLEGLMREIAEFSAESERLEEVLRQVAPPEPPRTARATARKPQEDLHVQVIEPQTVNLQSQTPEEEPVAVQPVDQGGELAETREGEGNRPAEAPRFTPRSGGEQRIRDRSGRLLRFPPRPAEAPGGVDEMTFLKSVALESPESDDPQARQRGAGSAKTLKCSECGAMNRPTEWYCERCGAELAAL